MCKKCYEFGHIARNCKGKRPHEEAYYDGRGAAAVPSGGGGAGVVRGGGGAVVVGGGGRGAVLPGAGGGAPLGAPPALINVLPPPHPECECCRLLRGMLLTAWLREGQGGGAHGQN